MVTEDKLPAYCEALIRFIASCMLDPHRYFEQKLLGELETADGPTARLALLERLLEWLSDGELLDPDQVQVLDRQLAGQQLPTTALGQQDPELLGLLLQGGIGGRHHERIERVIDDPATGAEDRSLLQAALGRSAH